MNSIKVEIPCPKCKKRMPVDLKQLSPGKHKVCMNCGADIVFEGDDVNALLNKHIDNIRKTFKRIAS